MSASSLRSWADDISLSPKSPVRTSAIQSQPDKSAPERRRREAIPERRRVEPRVNWTFLPTVGWKGCAAEASQISMRDEDI